ncbi:MAG: hydrogenase maturation protease [Magnetococcales bacterium]|nr:hydrogenase maturation protease [Magnetococcales bacterium]
MKPLILCVGNRYLAEDDTGPRVYDRLCAPPGPPPEVAVLDGGLAGLALLPLLEGRPRVVFVDRVEGFAPPGEVVTLRGEAVAALANGYGHNAGIPYLLAMLPKVSPPPWPEALLVGMAGEPDPSAIERLARYSIEVARHGLDSTRP